MGHTKFCFQATLQAKSINNLKKATQYISTIIEYQTRSACNKMYAIKKSRFSSLNSMFYNMNFKR